MESIATTVGAAVFDTVIDLVARTDAEGLQPERDGIRPVVQPDAVIDAVVAGELGLEAADRLAEDELPEPKTVSTASSKSARSCWYSSR